MPPDEKPKPPQPMPAANLRDVLESPLTPEGKILALWLAHEAPAPRDIAGRCLKLHAWEVEAACRDLARPQVRWMPRVWDSGALELAPDCPLLRVFKRPTKPTQKEPAT